MLLKIRARLRTRVLDYDQGQGRPAPESSMKTVGGALQQRGSNSWEPSSLFSVNRM